MVTKIVESFLKERKCAVDVLYRLGKIDIKELDETLNMIEFYRMTKAHELKETVVLDVGCGSIPTLGILYAFLFKSNKVIAIDPVVREKDYNTQNFEYKRLALREWDAKEIQGYKEIIILANHSHHSLWEVYALFNKSESLETIHYLCCPCCESNVPKGIKMETWTPKKSISPKNNYYYSVLTKETIPEEYKVKEQKTKKQKQWLISAAKSKECIIANG